MSSLEELKKYIEFLSTTDIEEIEIQSEDGDRIFLKRDTSYLRNNVLPSELQRDKESKQVLAKDQLQKPQKEEEEKPLVEEFTICSPMVGKFLLSVSADHPPFIMVGSQIKQGQKIAIIETMRILRDVISPKEGVVKKILVKDGEFVEYGQPLVVLEMKQGEK